MKNSIESVDRPPKSNNPTILELRDEVKAIQEEIDFAVTLHEAWKPAACDKELHKRMGHSYAANTFLVIRAALRREMLLALMRLWDKDGRSIRLENMATTLRNTQVMKELVLERTPLNLPGAYEQMAKDLNQKRDTALELINKYSRNGSNWKVRNDIQTLRHTNLAHRQIIAVAIDIDADEVELFYQDMCELVSLRLSLILATAYKLQRLVKYFVIILNFSGRPREESKPKVIQTTGHRELCPRDKPDYHVEKWTARYGVTVLRETPKIWASNAFYNRIVDAAHLIKIADLGPPVFVHFTCDRGDVGARCVDTDPSRCVSASFDLTILRKVVRLFSHNDRCARHSLPRRGIDHDSCFRLRCFGVRFRGNRASELAWGIWTT